MTFMERIPQEKKFSSTLLIILIPDLTPGRSLKVTLMDNLPSCLSFYTVASRLRGVSVSQSFVLCVSVQHVLNLNA